MVTVSLAAGLVLAGHLFTGQPVQHLGYDAAAYVAMVEGRGADAPSPFKFRLLVPLLARALPLPPAEALQAITYLSLFGAYLLILNAAAVVGLSVTASAFGLLSVWGSTWHLYHFYNPYLTDGAGLVALSAMVVAVLNGGFPLFAVAAIAGVLVRESTLVLVPAWLVTRQVARTVALLVVAGIAVWLPRYWLASDGDLTTALTNTGSLPRLASLVLARQLYAIWGFVWLLALAGFCYVPQAYRPKVFALFAALLAGSIIASAVATDTGRMFAFLAPVMAVGCAQLYEVLEGTSRPLAWLLVAVIAAQCVVNAPAVMFDPNHWIAGWPRRLFLTAELVLGGAILLTLVAGRRRSQQPDC